MPYRFLEHTADVLVECHAPDFGGLLTAAADALYETALRIVLPKVDTRRVISVSVGTHEEAVVRWLQELIFLLDVDRFVATRYEFDLESDLSFGATLSGYVCEPEERASEIKGATYHGMSVEKTEEGLRARIVFDL